ncbi:hypothetical protein ACQYWQ_09780 [Streptomyces sp. P6-2-1]|uniref:hypothetical protein n=1 Tax=unclassified Streptomyces TaxID=2593676 RepID=UPI003D36F7E9
MSACHPGTRVRPYGPRAALPRCPGASARTRVLNADTFTAAALAAVLVDHALPTAARDDRRREEAPN